MALTSGAAPMLLHSYSENVSNTFMMGSSSNDTVTRGCGRCCGLVATCCLAAGSSSLDFTRDDKPVDHASKVPSGFGKLSLICPLVCVMSYFTAADISMT